MSELDGLEKGALGNKAYDAYDKAYIRLSTIKILAPYVLKLVSLLTALMVLFTSSQTVERTFALGVLLGTSSGSLDKLSNTDIKRPTSRSK